MSKKTLAFVLIGVALLVHLSVAPAQANEHEPWNDEAFVKKVNTIKKQSWDKIETRDVAILQLFELGRLADEMESQLVTQTRRLYNLSFVGVVVVAIYLALQLLLTMVIVVRLGRLSGR